MEKSSPISRKMEGLKSFEYEKILIVGFIFLLTREKLGPAKATESATYFANKLLFKVVNDPKELELEMFAYKEDLRDRSANKK